MREASVRDHLSQLRKSLAFRAERALLDIAEQIAKTIRARRENIGWTQHDLAEQLNTKQSQVSRLEDPFYTRHSLLTLAKVADVLGCTLTVSLTPQPYSLTTNFELQPHLPLYVLKEETGHVPIHLPQMIAEGNTQVAQVSALI